MKVRILRASKKVYWYRDRIGEIFNVEVDYDEDGNLYCEDETGWIDKCDCEWVEW